MKISIKEKLRKAFRNKVNIKTKYYSLSSDEVKWRVISIYRIGQDFVQGYCHLRNEERTFVIDRIRSAIVQEEPYELPSNWKPKSKVWDSK